MSSEVLLVVINKNNHQRHLAVLTKIPKIMNHFVLQDVLNYYFDEHPYESVTRRMQERITSIFPRISQNGNY